MRFGERYVSCARLHWMSRLATWLKGQSISYKFDFAFETRLGTTFPEEAWRRPRPDRCSNSTRKNRTRREYMNRTTTPKYRSSTLDQRFHITLEMIFSLRVYPRRSKHQLHLFSLALLLLPFRSLLRQIQCLCFLLLHFECFARHIETNVVTLIDSQDCWSWWEQGGAEKKRQLRVTKWASLYQRRSQRRLVKTMMHRKNSFPRWPFLIQASRRTISTTSLAVSAPCNFSVMPKLHLRSCTPHFLPMS